MIFGDPYRFAILFEKIEPWNFDDNFIEGICALFIDGNMIPNILPDTSTSLPHSISEIQDFFNIIDCLENHELFNMKKNERFDFLYKTTSYENEELSEEESSDYIKYCLSGYIDNPHLEDMVWYVSSGEKEKILYITNGELRENILDKGYIKNVLSSVITFFFDDDDYDKKQRKKFD